MPSLMATLGANISPFMTEMNRAKNSAGNIGGAIGSSFAGMLTSRLAGIASVGSLTALANEAMQLGDRMEELSARTNISTEDLQRLSFGAKLTAGSLETHIAAIEKLSIAQAKAKTGDKEMGAALKGFGMSDAQIADTTHLMSTYLMVGERIKGMEISGELEKNIRAIFGKSGSELIAPFKLNLKAEVESLDVPMISAENMAALAESHDIVVKAKEGFMAAMMSFGVEGSMLVAALFKDLINPKGVGSGDSATAAFFERQKAMGKRLSGGDIDRAPDPDIVNTFRNAYKKEMDGKEAAAKAKKEEEEKSPAFIKAEKAKEAARQKEIAHLKAIQQEAIRQGELAKLTDFEKVKRFRREADNKIWSSRMTDDEVTKLKLLGEAQKLTNEADEIVLKAGRAAGADDTKPTVIKPLVNSLQQQGLYLGSFVAAPQIVAMDVHKKNESHLSKIASHSEAMRKGIDALSKGSPETAGVQY